MVGVIFSWKYSGPVIYCIQTHVTNPSVVPHRGHPLIKGSGLFFCNLMQPARSQQRFRNGLIVLTLPLISSGLKPGWQFVALLSTKNVSARILSGTLFVIFPKKQIVLRFINLPHYCRENDWCSVVKLNPSFLSWRMLMCFWARRLLWAACQSAYECVHVYWCDPVNV